MRKSHTECRAGGRTGRVSGALCERKISVKIKPGEDTQDSGKAGTGVRGRYMGVEESTGKEIGGRSNANECCSVRMCHMEAYAIVRRTYTKVGIRRIHRQKRDTSHTDAFIFY